MSITERILNGVRDLIRQQDKIDALTAAVKELAAEVRELDRRVVRIETLVEVARSQAERGPLPPK